MKSRSGIPPILVVVLATSLSVTEANAQDDWQSAYQMGDAVELKITDGIWQSCTVSENPPGGMTRVMCEEYVEPAPGTYTRAGGSYIVYGPSDLRHTASAAAAPASGGPVDPSEPAAGTSAARPANTPVPAVPPARNAPSVGIAPAVRTAPQGAGVGLRVGEYACYGSGGQILAGLGFKALAGGRYTDLEGGNAGSYVVTGGTVTFRGGHLDGTVGRGLDGGNFQVGAGAVCEPW